MSFGNRSDHSRVRRKPRPEVEAEDETESAEDEKRFQPELLGYITALIMTIATFGGLIAAAPHTYSAPNVRLNWNHVSTGAGLASMSDEDREAFVSRHGIDFSRILTPASQETTPATREIARKCNKARPRELVVNHIDASRLFRQSTGYLLCAMRLNRERLCNSADRQRLVEQLMHYRDRRQDIFAINGVLEQINVFATTKADYILPKYLPSKIKDGKRIAATTRIYDNLHPRLAKEMATLVANGYLSASDFGYFGLYLPELYTPVLTETPVVQRLCG